MLTKLNMLSTEVLQEMTKSIGVILGARLDTRIQPGRIATFNNRGIETSVRIEKINQKTASCTEISPKSGARWKVGLTSLKVEPIERLNPLAISKPTAAYKPASVSEDSW